MANPIHQLKQGIRLRNWALVVGAYEDLAGEAAPEPETGRELPKPPAEKTKKRGRRTSQEITNQLIEAQPEDITVSQEIITQEPEKLVSEPDQPEVGEDRLVDTTTQEEVWKQLSSGEYQTSTEESKQEDGIFRANKQPVAAYVPDGQEDGKRYTRKVDARGTGVNVFTDNLGVSTKELKQDRLLVQKGVRQPQRAVENRAPVQKVKARCRGCNNDYMVLPADLPGRVTADATPSFTCNNCIRAARDTKRE